MVDIEELKDFIAMTIPCFIMGAIVGCAVFFFGFCVLYLIMNPIILRGVAMGIGAVIGCYIVLCIIGFLTFKFLDWRESDVHN